MSKVANCIVCGAEFQRRHSNHTICKNPECKRAHYNAVNAEWRYKTGRNRGPKDNLWTAEERQFLRDNRFMETKDIAAKLGRSADSVREKRCRMKLPQLSMCVKCGVEHQTINQHHTCEQCVPNQKEYAANYKNGLNGRWQMYRANARKRKLPFELTIEQFAEFWQKPCSYCGSEIETVGIDRVDSSLGYLAGNLVSCCGVCNQSKNDLTRSAWIAHLKAVLTNLGETL
jgi:hypothetical protein